MAPNPANLLTLSHSTPPPRVRKFVALKCIPGKPVLPKFTTTCENRRGICDNYSKNLGPSQFQCFRKIPVILLTTPTLNADLGSLSFSMVRHRKAADIFLTVLAYEEDQTGQLIGYGPGAWGRNSQIIKARLAQWIRTPLTPL